MALDLTQLKKNYQEPTDEVSQRDRRGFSKMEKQIAALFAQLGSSILISAVRSGA